MNKKLVIVGGGTAGWITALYFQKNYTDYEITLIESTELGILGAGESSTPNLGGMLTIMGIDIDDFITNTGATIKTANHFIRWSLNEDAYYHKFEKHADIEQTDFVRYGFHFDARRCGAYFKKIALDRGITHIDAIISHFSKKENGDVSHIHLKDNTSIECDYMIDCSGFARVGVGKLYNSEWKSYSEFLPANSAIAYFLPQEKNLKNNDATQTRSIAMKAGWMWQVPLKHRMGCGYVFNDNYISIDEAKKEVEDYLGREIEVVKNFKFEAGSYKDTWINNCISLGLASGFLEPLEGTSLMTLIWSVLKLHNLGGIENESNRDRYNEFVRDVNYQSMLFVRHHYNCGRVDTKFWRDIQSTKNPKELQTMIDIGFANIKTTSEMMDIINPKSELPIFDIENYTTVLYGQRQKNKKTII
jgi:tryptophan halogenase